MTIKTTLYLRDLNNVPQQVGSENDLSVNLEMRNGGVLYWLPPSGAAKQVDYVVASAADGDGSSLELAVNIARNGATPTIEQVCGSASASDVTGSVSWKYNA